MQRRKRIENLVAAFKLLDRRDVGLILAGPDTEGVLRDVRGENIHILGPIYGDEILDLLSACDVFCLPGAVGLSIVDAFYCGLPIVTEEGDESPEIMYLKDGVNGFVVPRNDIQQLKQKLELLLGNDAFRKQFSIAARGEIMTNGHIDKMCQGFADALRFVRNGRSPAGESLGQTTPVLRRKSS
jgi:glycosyltransferase involved in cell wall biosynthesis